MQENKSPVVEVFTSCTDTTDPAAYAIDCLGTEIIKEIVHYPTKDTETPHCAFTTNEYKVYRFIDWGLWSRVDYPPDIISCVEEPDDLDGGRPYDDEPTEPISKDDKGPSPCLEKILQWSRDPHIMYSKASDYFDALRMSSLQDMASKRLFSFIRQQRRSGSGTLGTGYSTAVRNPTKLKTLILISEKRKWQTFIVATSGNKVALCIGTRTGKLYFVEGVGYNSMLELIGLERWWLKK